MLILKARINQIIRNKTTPASQQKIPDTKFEIKDFDKKGNGIVCDKKFQVKSKKSNHVS